MELVDAGLEVPAGFTTAPADVRSDEGRALLGVDVARVRQVHGTHVVVVDGPGDHGEADGLVTTTPGTPLLVVAADCMPVLLVGDGVVGAAHAGRPGLVAGVLQATVAAMRELGATRVRAVVGPSIGGCCYELPAAMVDEIADRLPAARATTTWGTPSIDLRSGADAVLRELEVEVGHVGGCTYEQPGRFHSFRRDATTARHGGIVRLP